MWGISSRMNTAPTIEQNVPSVRIASFIEVPSPELPRPERSSSIRRVRTLANLAVVVVFFVACLLPLYGYAFREPPPLDENRERTQFPMLVFKKYSIQDYPKWFEMHFADYLGYRDVLLRWHRKAVIATFDESSSAVAWVGRDGWLYLNVDDPDANKPDKPSMNKRLNAWADTFAERKRYLAERGIEYIVVIAPEKSSIYPEHLPLRRRRNPPPEPAEQFTRFLLNRGVRCVNLLPALQQARRESDELLYFKTDTHWAPAGARIGYRALLPELQKALPGFQPTAEEQHDRVPTTGGGDLWKFISADDEFPGEPCVQFQARNRGITQSIPAFHDRLEKRDNQGHIPLMTYSTPNAHGPKMLLLRDSFSTAMMSFWCADFQEVTAVATHRFPLVAVESTKPKIVVQQIVARFLYQEAASPMK